ncbi:MAG: hypothetical protein JW917_05860 [Ignavibacteria bacterium]|nr:hypothetical protein [Ignavibacteria bacterium]
MTFEEEYLDVLQNLEFAIVNTYRENNDLIDFDVLIVLDAIMNFYISGIRGKEPRNFNLSGKQLELYGAVKEMAEYRITGMARDDMDAKYEIKPISVNELLDCLKRIKKSVQFWTKEGGRQGYLEYISNYIV